MTVLPTSCRRAGLRFLEPDGRPGPGVLGLGALAGKVIAGRMFRNRAEHVRLWVGRGGGLLPRTAQILDEATREAELGMGGDDQPGPAVGGLGSTDLRTGPAQGLLEQPKRVLEIEPAQVGLPPAVHVPSGGAGGRGPQPDRVEVAVAGQVVDLNCQATPPLNAAA